MTLFGSDSGPFTASGFIVSVGGKKKKRTDSASTYRTLEGLSTWRSRCQGEQSLCPRRNTGEVAVYIMNSDTHSHLPRLRKTGSWFIFPRKIRFLSKKLNSQVCEGSLNNNKIYTPSASPTCTHIASIQLFNALFLSMNSRECLLWTHVRPRLANIWVVKKRKSREKKPPKETEPIKKEEKKM